ncbi:MAG TPA: DNA methyltransferase [Sulfolobales archaeon]|nr:DNA methyltransferase [Sulfolobales archaeon]
MGIGTRRRGGYRSMRLVSFEEYLEYVKSHDYVRIEDEVIPVGRPHEIKYYQPRDFVLERTSVWSFPDRGDWATHKGDYRGNWAPQIPRNLILRYSRPGELVLDPMCGGGTTLVEAKLLGRNAIGVDINYEAVILTLDRLNFTYKPLDPDYREPDIKVYHGDARNLDLIEDESVDLVATHPPYANIIRYSKGEKIEGDLSRVSSLEEYLEGMLEIASEIYRVLKPGRYAAILIGDTRKNRHYIPIAFRVMQQFLDVGFILKEDIIKIQWNTKVTGEKWAGLAKTAEECWVEKPQNKRHWTDFYLIAHEHLFIFRKPGKDEKIERYKYSTKWW